MIEEDDELDKEDPEAILPDDLFREDPEDDYDPMDLYPMRDDYD